MTLRRGRGYIDRIDAYKGREWKKSDMLLEMEGSDLLTNTGKGELSSALMAVIGRSVGGHYLMLCVL